MLWKTNVNISSTNIQPKTFRKTDQVPHLAQQQVQLSMHSFLSNCVNKPFLKFSAFDESPDMLSLIYF